MTNAPGEQPPLSRRADSSRLPVRRRPAHGVDPRCGDHPIVYVTVCTNSRGPWLAKRDVHARLLDVWRDAGAWHVGRYVVMPDHVHFFAQPAGDLPLENWIAYWKRVFTIRHNVPSERWQKNYWDTRMRSAAQYDEKWEYVFQNPVRRGLVGRAEDWPFAGEVSRVEW